MHLFVWYDRSFFDPLPSGLVEVLSQFQILGRSRRFAGVWPFTQLSGLALSELDFRLPQNTLYQDGMFGNMPKFLSPYSILENADESDDEESIEIDHESVFSSMLNCIRYCRDPIGKINASFQRSECRCLDYFGKHFDYGVFAHLGNEVSSALFPWGCWGRWTIKVIPSAHLKVMRCRVWPFDLKIYHWGEAMSLLVKIVPHIVQDHV
jgi:hypothetical protein